MIMKFRSIETAAYLALGLIIGLILHELFTSLLSKYVDDIPIPFEAFPEPPWRYMELTVIDMDLFNLCIFSYLYLHGS